MSETTATPIEINLTAAIVAVDRGAPQILTTGRDASSGAIAGLPSGLFDAQSHRTLEIGLRSWVKQQTRLDIGYAEQLYTFGDRGRHAHPGDTGPHVVSIGYLALTGRPDEDALRVTEGVRFQPWYSFFPWEDWRAGPPEILQQTIRPLLARWAAAPVTGLAGRRAPGRAARIKLAFGNDGDAWDDEKVLERYELLYSAGLVDEALRDGREAAHAWDTLPVLGEPMRFDHRRILATAIGRLRGKMRYRPVVFEMMDPTFTLTALQRTVEAISGRHVHKQNFRRLVEASALVEPAGGRAGGTGGRPAQLFRFRGEAIEQGTRAGFRLKRRG